MPNRIRRHGGRLLLGLSLLLASGYGMATHYNASRVGKPFGNAMVLAPSGPVRGVVVLMGDHTRRDAEEYRLAQAMTRQGLLVGLVPASASLAAATRCDQLPDAVERVARRLMRRAGVEDYLAPVVVGMGTSGTRLARLTAAGAQPHALGAVLLVGAAPAQSLAPTSSCGADGGMGWAQLSGQSPQAIATEVTRHLPAPVPRFRALPLVELRAPTSHRLVILMSGDGGWRSLDSGLAARLRADGNSVLGWDSLRYFWTQRSPEGASADLAAVIEEYRHRWHADEVDLVGYSFGADAMPFLYNRLPPAQRQAVGSLSLLGLGHHADFRVTVGGWLGKSQHNAPAVAPQLAQIPSQRVLCVYGAEEKDSLCPELAASGIRAVRTAGGHHFDGDLAAMAARLEANFARNGATAPSG
ncbi:AcvB/VirJ family lysyl-phosphatidylglycerol hydrolase [Pseudoxanthomonas composti]|uniref:Virulence factor family protein n=1 Tax=Pseudoxanthomonas composti TaxID=2137479 RepID=A0A4Q1JR82_9GAMM|nr:AcvB/VirJ family lysyl-phosphatidylglycerol hydrolase [Pseudoxanthomonas composti]RXQ99942.1 virulence factor family protein [Pseudoxanthomonas composti]